MICSPLSSPPKTDLHFAEVSCRGKFMATIFVSHSTFPITPISTATVVDPRSGSSSAGNSARMRYFETLSANKPMGLMEKFKTAKRDWEAYVRLNKIADGSMQENIKKSIDKKIRSAEESLANSALHSPEARRIPREVHALYSLVRNQIDMDVLRKPVHRTPAEIRALPPSTRKVIISSSTGQKMPRRQ